MIKKQVVIFGCRFIVIDTLTCSSRQNKMFPGPNIEVALSFTVISNVAITTQTFVSKVGRSSLGILSLIQNRLLKPLLDCKITLMLHWGSVLLKQLHNLDLKFKKNWPKKGGTIKISFSGTVIKVLSGTKILFKKVLTHWFIKVTG